METILFQASVYLAAAVIQFKRTKYAGKNLPCFCLIDASHLPLSALQHTQPVPARHAFSRLCVAHAANHSDHQPPHGMALVLHDRHHQYGDGHQRAASDALQG